MNEESIIDQTEDIKEPDAATEEETAEVSDEPAEEMTEEPLVMPLKPTNRFFLAALFPLAFIIILGIVLLVGRLTGTDRPASVATTAMAEGEGISVTEPPYYEVKADEVRGVYIATVHNINFPSSDNLGAAALKAELDQILIRCAETGLNAVYFQVSPFSDALYDSDILPTSSVLTGTEGAPLPDGFDPLGYLCEKAHKAGIAVHAWVNPMRITGGELDGDRLHDYNPANIEYGYVVNYDGELYYDLGHPETRKLQARVCAEIAERYPVDGIMFDDYFYPYPIEGQTFNDRHTYELYGGDYDSIEDFRRASTTALVSECYDAIKATRPDCQFGVAPFGIWRNDDGANGGSATRGMESWDSVYCDTLAFIKAGKVDYIAPQIYWTFENSVAPYGVLCDWWAAAVKDTGVRLLISHAAYQAESWDDGSEYAEQVEYARTKRDYYGSIYYGYESICGNEGGIADAFAEIYMEE